jgi:hypothetical protein
LPCQRLPEHLKKSPCGRMRVCSPYLAPSMLYSEARFLKNSIRPGLGMPGIINAVVRKMSLLNLDVWNRENPPARGSMVDTVPGPGLLRLAAVFVLFKTCCCLCDWIRTRRRQRRLMRFLRPASAILHDSLSRRGFLGNRNRTVPFRTAVPMGSTPRIRLDNYRSGQAPGLFPWLPHQQRFGVPRRT